MHENDAARKTESENTGETFQAMILILKRAPISRRATKRGPRREIFRARARARDVRSAEIRVTRQLPIYLVFFFLSRGRRDAAAGSLLYSLPAVSSREVCHDISKGELPTPGMSDRVHFADLSCKHEAGIGR